jgi:hypothetical protein
LAKSFATNVFIWSGWGILYAIFASLITAIQANRISDLSNSTFLGFFRGGLDSTALGLISIFYALALFLIPFIAKKLVSGDVGSAAYAMVRAAAVAAGAAVSAGAGFAAGTSAAEASSAAGAAGGVGSSAATATSAATSSCSPPPEPSLAGTIRSGMASALNAESAHPQPAAAKSNEQSGGGKGEGKSDGSGGGSQSRSSSQGGVGTFRPIGMGQTLAYQAGRAMGASVSGAVRGKQGSDNANGNGDGKE